MSSRVLATVVRRANLAPRVFASTSTKDNKDSWNKAKDTAEDAASKIKDTASKKWDELKDESKGQSVSEKYETAKQKISEGVDQVKSSGKDSSGSWNKDKVSLCPYMQRTRGNFVGDGYLS